MCLVLVSTFDVGSANLKDPERRRDFWLQIKRRECTAAVRSVLLHG